MVYSAYPITSKLYSQEGGPGGFDDDEPMGGHDEL
jgi:hypothetical protein